MEKHTFEGEVTRIYNDPRSVVVYVDETKEAFDACAEKPVTIGQKVKITVKKRRGETAAWVEDEN